MTVYTWRYTVNGGPESAIHSPSTDPDEIRGLVASVFHTPIENITVRRLPHDRT